jgi:hypothetical protein
LQYLPLAPLEGNVEEVEDVEGRPWNYSSQVNEVCYKLRITGQCTFFCLFEYEFFTGSRKEETLSAEPAQ